MAKSNRVKPVAAAVGIAFVSSLVVSGAALASDNPFDASDLDTGYMLAGGHGDKHDKKHEEGKCGEGKCGEGKCGEKAEAEGKCGEGKCGEGKCGEKSEKGEEGKCGEGKCGGA